jgi:hypothetical protein
VIRGTLAVVVLAVLLGAGSAAAAEKQAYPVSFHAFALASGTTAGTQLDKGGGLVVARAVRGRVDDSDRWDRLPHPSLLGAAPAVAGRLLVAGR